MKRIVLTCYLFFLSYTGFAQIRFEAGYFITNSKERIDCLIKDVDWKNNPKKIDFKLNEAGQIESKTVEDVSEFGIVTEEKKVKYVSATVNIDRASDIGNKLSSNRLPEWKKEKVFLKLLIKGEASLFQYSDKNLIRFFFNTVKNDSIQQLVYKRYRPEAMVIKTNNTFRQQLVSFVKCDKIQLSNIGKLQYKLKSLIDYFLSFNENCSNKTYETYIDSKNANEKVTLGLKIVGTLNNSQFKIINSPTLDFKNKLTIGGSLEVELFLPFNRNKWRLILGSNFQYYEDEIVQTSQLTSIIRESNINYSSVDLLVGLRHYFYLSDEWKLFINGGYIYDITAFDSFARRSTFTAQNKISGNGTYLLGLGLEYKSISLELRHYGSKNIINAIQDIANPDIISSYNRLSINLGLRVF